MSEEGKISPVELKFQQSYCSPNMSGPRPDKSKKHLWNPVKGSDKSDGPDLK
jgi:hypothetical protein